MRVILFLTLILSSTHTLGKWPELLVFDDGRKIETLEDWQERRPEIRHHLQDKIFGYYPTDLPTEMVPMFDYELKSIDAIYRHVEIRFPTLNTDRIIRLGLFIPKDKRDQKLPVFLSLNKCGNHTLVEDEIIPIVENLPHHPIYCVGKERGSLKENYPVEKILQAGYIFATFDKSEMDADDYLIQDDGIKALVQTHQDPNKSWGTIAAWSYGLTKAVDWLYQDSHVNSDQIIVTGHSRRGKAALLAGIMDERIDMVIPHQSGLGGTARYRVPIMRESAKMMTHGHYVYKWINEPHSLRHFFSAEFANWSTRLRQLPIDAHHALAMIAPRPLMDSQGDKDFWAGPGTSIKMLRRAKKVYKLYGVDVPRHLRDRGTIEKKNLIQFCANTGHVANEFYWSKFIEFANLHFRSHESNQ